MGMLQDFKDFALKGNLVDMAVGIVMGTAVGAMVKSFMDNIVSPLIGKVLGVPDMSAWKIPLGGEMKNPADPDGPAIQAAIQIGTFVQNCLDFLILAFAVFIAIKVVNSFMKKAEEDAPPPAQEVLLGEIRDLLAKK